MKNFFLGGLLASAALSLLSTERTAVQATRPEQRSVSQRRSGHRRSARVSGVSRSDSVYSYDSYSGSMKSPAASTARAVSKKMSRVVKKQESQMGEELPVRDVSNDPKLKHSMLRPFNFNGKTLFCWASGWKEEDLHIKIESPPEGDWKLKIQVVAGAVNESVADLSTVANSMPVPAGCKLEGFEVKEDILKIHLGGACAR